MVISFRNFLNSIKKPFNNESPVFINSKGSPYVTIKSSVDMSEFCRITGIPKPTLYLFRKMCSTLLIGSNSGILDFIDINFNHDELQL